MGQSLSPGTARSGVSTYKRFRVMIAISNDDSVRYVDVWKARQSECRRTSVSTGGQRLRANESDGRRPTTDRLLAGPGAVSLAVGHAAEGLTRFLHLLRQRGRSDRQPGRSLV